MGPDFVVQVKCTIFWLNRGLRIYLNFVMAYFPKSTSKYLFGLSTFFFSTKHSTLEAVWFKRHSNQEKPNVATSKNNIKLIIFFLEKYE